MDQAHATPPVDARAGRAGTATATGPDAPKVFDRTQILVGRGGGENVCGSARLVALGPLDASQCSRFAHALDRLGRLTSSDATVDLRGVPIIDTTAELVLTQHARRFAREGRIVRILPPRWAGDGWPEERTARVPGH